jgi:hypothetical protein
MKIPFVLSGVMSLLIITIVPAQTQHRSDISMRERVIPADPPSVSSETRRSPVGESSRSVPGRPLVIVEPPPVRTDQERRMNPTGDRDVACGIKTGKQC